MKLKPAAVHIFNKLNVLKNTLLAGKTRVEFLPLTEECIRNSNMSNIELANCVEFFQEAFSKASEKLIKHMDKQHDGLKLLNLIRIFDPRPRQKHAMPRDITAYSIILNWKTSGDILT